jgi:ADP-ribose diphosphatase
LSESLFKPIVVEEEKTKTLSEGHFRFEERTLRVETFAGPMSGPQTREVLRSGRAVAVLLYDFTAHRLVLIEQFRIGAYLNDFRSPRILECVAGMIDEGEDPEQAARREVEEEIGHPVGRMEEAGSYLSSPGISDELITLYIGSVDAAIVGGEHGLVEEGEDIRTCVFTVDEAMALADTGKVANIVAQLALLWFARHGQALRQRWLAASERDLATK